MPPKSPAHMVVSATVGCSEMALQRSSPTTIRSISPSYSLSVSNLAEKAMASESITCGRSSLHFQGARIAYRSPIPIFRVSVVTRPRPRLPISISAVVKRSPKRLKYSSPTRKGEGMLYIKVDPLGADTWKLEPVIELLKDGAVGVIPTDTVYAIVCDMNSHSSIERLRRIKDIDTLKPLSILCRSLRDVDTYTTGFPRGNSQGQTNIFRAVKHCLPGPYTFILPASKELPKQCIRYGAAAKYASRKKIGIRMPDDTICQAILEKLDAPLISTSVKWPTQDEWMIDPVLIADIYEPEGLDFVVDGGVRVADPSTVVDMTGRFPTVIRQGKGPKQDWMLVKDDRDTSTQKEELAPNAT